MSKYFSGLSANTFLIALASLFADTSTEMLYHTPEACEGVLVGERVGRRLLYRGVVGWGIGRATVAELLERCPVARVSPFVDPPGRAGSSRDGQRAYGGTPTGSGLSWHL